MSKIVEVESLDNSGRLHEIDRRDDSWHQVRWGLIENDSAVAVDVVTFGEDILPFRLRVLDSDKATDIFEHPFYYVPGEIALVGAGVHVESDEVV